MTSPLARLFAIVLAVAVMMSVMFAASCARPPSPLPPAAASLLVTPFCVAMLAVDGQVDVVGKVCTDALWSCERVRAAAQSVGGMAGIVEVGECAEESER